MNTKDVLGRKHSVSDAEMYQRFLDIEHYMTEAEYRQYEASAISRILGAIQMGKCGYGWSAGKDSIVLAYLCDQFNLPALAYFPSKQIWFTENIPFLLDKPNAEIVIDNDFCLDLYKQSTFNPSLFRITEDRINEPWWKRRWPAQHRWASKNKLDFLILGRRLKDNNYCGRNGISTNKNYGTTTLNPLYDWPHEAIFACLHYNGISLPPSKYYPGCFKIETYWYPDYKAQTERDGWEFIAEYDRANLRIAAEHFPIAKEVLKDMEG